MAIRQYIGARYVPLYVGDWDITRNYEPLTIVTDANGNSFTSLKDVPAGTPLNDRNYWIQTSSFSAAVDGLQRRMTVVENDVLDLQTDFSGIQTDLSGVQTDVTTLQGNVTTLQGNVTTLQTDVNDLKNRVSTENRKFILVGDSYSRPAESYVEKAKMLFGTDRVFAYDWSILMPPGFATPTLDFKTMLQAITPPNDDEITDIVVLGGTNDLAYINSVPAKIDDFCTYARNRFKNAEISIGYLAMGRDAKVATALCRYYIEGAARNCVKYIDGIANLMCDPQYLSGDGVHPTTAGYTYYAPYIIQAFVQGYAKYNNTFVIPLTLANSFTYGSGITSASLRVEVTERAVVLRIVVADNPNGNVNHGTTQIANGETVFTLGAVFPYIMGFFQYLTFGEVYTSSASGDFRGAYAFAMKSLTEIGLYGQSNLFSSPASGESVKATIQGASNRLVVPTSY